MAVAQDIRQALREEASPQIYARGSDYFRAGRVSKLSVDEDFSEAIIAVTGKVKGNNLYKVEVDFDFDGESVATAFCNCPFEGECCKHVVALGLAYAESLERENKKGVSPRAKKRTIATDADADDEARMREALRNLGIAAEVVPEHLIKELLAYQNRNSSPVPGATAPQVIELPGRILPKPFKPDDYFISLSSYQNYAPTFHQKANPYQQASVAKILAREDITAAQRELLAYIYQSAPPDFEKLFPLVVESGFPVYRDYYHSYDNRKLAIDVNPTPLKAEIIYEPVRPWSSRQDPDSPTRHDFFLRMPNEYWKKDPWSGEPFFARGSIVVRDLEHTIEVHRLTPFLANMIGRVRPVFDYENGERKIKARQAELAGADIAQFDTLVADASRMLRLTTPPPDLKLQPEPPPVPAPGFVVDFDNDAQTLHVAPVIDYGIYRQEVSESVYEAHRADGPKLKRRPPFEHPGTHIITVKDGLIYYANVNEKKEIGLYRTLTHANKAEEFGFTKTLKCQKHDPRSLDEYFRTAWPALAAFAKEKNYPILFTKDKLPLEAAAFRADFSADISDASDWLYFDVDVYCGGERVTLEKLLAYLSSGQPFWRKDDGTLVEISNREELERLARLLESFHAREAGGFEGNLHHAPELEYVMTSSKHYNAARAKSFRQFLNRVQSGKPVKAIHLPKKLIQILRPYQRSGIEWLYFLRSYRFAGILADDMGLGKTVQALAIMALEKNPERPSIVICPKSLLYNWKLEAEKFFPELNVLVYEGPPAEREALRKKITGCDLVVVGYGTLKRDEEAFAESHIKFNYAVLDEAQFIKNHATKGAQIVKKLNADYRLALTGTPLENSVSELWSIYDFLMPGFLGAYERFAKNFHRPIMDAGDRQALEHLRHKVEHFMLRRTKTEVLAELPPKIEQMSQCHLSDAQNILYQQVLAQVRGEVFAAVNKKGFKSAQIHILAGLTKLRQACNHPALLIKEKDWRKYESAKLDMCMELVEEVVEGKRKVLIFSQFTQMLDIVSAALADRGIAHLYLSGKTNHRQDLVNQFNTDPAVPVFLISLKAGGTGLNLTAADTVVVFDPWWNPSVENQAIDRAHRIGQTKTVNVYRLLTSGTIEEKIQALKQKKQNLFDSLVGASGDTFKKLTWDDVRELFAE